MLKTSILNNKLGISMVEVLFSVAILSLVIVGVLLVFVNAVDISKRVDYEYKAVNLAKKRIEDAKSIIKTAGFDSLIVMEESPSMVNAEGVLDPDGEFERSTDVTEDFGGNALLTGVEVEVYYYYLGKKKKSPITMTTVFTRLE